MRRSILRALAGIFVGLLPFIAMLWRALNGSVTPVLYFGVYGVLPGHLFRGLLAGGAHSAFGDWRDGVAVVVGSALFWTVLSAPVVVLVVALRRRRVGAVQAR